MLNSILRFLSKKLSINHIVEQGKKEGWNYRKWYDGSCEATNRYIINNLPIEGSAWPGMYYKITEIPLPPEIFISVEMALADCYWGTGTAFSSARSFNDSKIQVICYSNQNGGSAQIYCMVVGRWK